MPIGRSLGYDFRAADGARAGTVIDYHRLLENLGQPCRDQPRGEVGRCARRLRHHDAYRARRIRRGIRLREHGGATHRHSQHRHLPASNHDEPLISICFN